MPTIEAHRPVIFYGNHVGWWDPILYLLLIARLTPHHRGFGPIDENALKKYGFLRRVGLFPVAQDTARGAVQFLATSRRILQERNTSLWMTPQGEFSDPRARPIIFKAGIAHLAREVPGLVFVPVAVEYTFWTERRPECLVAFGAPFEAPGEQNRSVDEWRKVLEENLEERMNDLTAAAIHRDSTEFDELVRGSTGISYPYDAWRWLKALAKGEQFSSAHRSK
nr:lysophospholipid acyltransferase family protein [Rhodoligotrophos appendicifer]